MSIETKTVPSLEPTDHDIARWLAEPNEATDPIDRSIRRQTGQEHLYNTMLNAESIEHTGIPARQLQSLIAESICKRLYVPPEAYKYLEECL